MTETASAGSSSATGFSLGIDIGGSGIKGAPVDLEVGKFAAERLRIDTPAGATPDDIFAVVEEVAAHFASLSGDSPIGVTVPAAVTHGVVRTAANIDKAWIGVDAQAELTRRLGRSVVVLNDADAAGMAELAYGAAKGIAGTVFIATLGTGIGTVLVVDGTLVPNTELGHIELDGHDAETRASNAARKNENLSWQEWAARLQRYFGAIENLFWPDLIVVGGGVSKKADQWLGHLDLRTHIVPAQLRNDAGIIGAAWLAAQAVAASSNAM